MYKRKVALKKRKARRNFQNIRIKTNECSCTISENSFLNFNCFNNERVLLSTLAIYYLKCVFFAVYFILQKLIFLHKFKLKKREDTNAIGDIPNNGIFNRNKSFEEEF